MYIYDYGITSTSTTYGIAALREGRCEYLFVVCMHTCTSLSDRAGRLLPTTASSSTGEERASPQAKHASTSDSNMILQYTLYYGVRVYSVLEY